MIVFTPKPTDKTAEPPKPETDAAKRSRKADTDGKARRERQLVDDSRLI